MPKQRLDVLNRARELLSAYTDDEILADRARDSIERLDIMSRIVEIEHQLRDEFRVERSTAIHAAAVIPTERRRASKP